MKRTALLLLVLISGLRSRSDAAEARIAFLKDNHVLATRADGKNSHQIDTDPRRKGFLRVDTTQERLSYLVDAQKNEKGRLVVIDTAGQQVAEVGIRPVTDPPTGGMDVLDDVQWTTEGKVRIVGSINPSKCEMFDLDVVSGRESNGLTRVCGTFTSSPDGQHVAWRGRLNHFAAEEINASTPLD